jgi:hypothetical protein
VPGAYDSQALNRYAYVRNNPLGRIDPSGNWSLDVGLGIGTLSFSDTDWVDFTPGFNLGVGFTTQTYGSGFGFSLFGGGSGAELSAFGFDQDFRFGVAREGAYSTTPFGSLGAGLPTSPGARNMALAQSVNRELGRARISSLPQLDGRSWQVAYDQSYSAAKAETFSRRTAVVVGPYAFSGPTADLDDTVGHEFSHVFDYSSDSFFDRVVRLEEARGSSGAGGSDLASDASELRAYANSMSFAAKRGASWRAQRNAEYHFDRYERALETLGAGTAKEVLSWDVR